MSAIETAQKKRPETSAGSAWLRGGQTIAHTYDMVVELWRKLKWILLGWACVCFAVADHAAPDGDQLYAGLDLIANVYRYFGPPLPQELSVVDPSGVSHLIAAKDFDTLAFARVGADTDFGFMWKGFWFWLLGSICVIAFLSYAFIRSGDEKLESHDIRGQQIVSLRTLIALIRRYNVAKAADINLDMMAKLGLLTPGAEAGRWREALAEAKVFAAQVRPGGQRTVTVDRAGEAQAVRRVLTRRAWRDGAVSPSETAVLRTMHAQAAEAGLPFYVEPDHLMQPAIAKVGYPYKAEYEHTLVVGGTGSGKSVAIHGLIDSIRQRGDCAIIYDPEGEFIRAHYDADRDLIFNPFDARSVDWSPYMDLSDLTHWQSSAADLFPDPKTGDPYWTNATRTIYAYAGWLLGTTTRARHGRNPTINDPTLGDAEADEILRNREGERPAVDHAIAHMRMVNELSSNGIDALGLSYSYEPGGWSRGTEATFQARILQQVATYYHLKAPGPEQLDNVVARHSFAVSYAYGTPRHMHGDGWHFILVPFAYLEFVHFSTQALVGCLAVENPSDAWATIGTPLPPTPPCPPVLKKLIARLLTYPAFDPLDPGENVVQKLVDHSAWFANAEEGVETSPMEIHLGYSAVDFALSHELGHRFLHGVDFDAAAADEEEMADQVGFALYHASWGWRADILEDAPFSDTGAILLGPIWFFYTAGLLFQMKLALKRRFDALGISFDDFDSEKANRHLGALQARWEKQRESQNGFLSFIADRGAGLSQDELDRLGQLIDRAEDLRALSLQWIDAIPDGDIRYAFRLGAE